MIIGIPLLRNIGQFDSVDTAANIPFKRLTVIYAENGRGKTTLSAVFRSLATGDPAPIAERRRFTAANPPHIVLECAGNATPAIFQNSAWTRTKPNVTVFDDVFVDENVYSGLGVESEHRQNLHELILGAQGVALNGRLRGLIADIEKHGVALRTKTAAIPQSDLGPLSVDDFCALPPHSSIDEEILSLERALAAMREQDPIRNTPSFDPLMLPAFAIEEVQRVLQADLPSLEAAAAARVQAHLKRMDQGAEAWIAEGMNRMAGTSATGEAGACPFCAQDLGGSPVIGHYRAYFSDSYSPSPTRHAETPDAH